MCVGVPGGKGILAGDAHPKHQDPELREAGWVAKTGVGGWGVNPLLDLLHPR